MKITNTDLTGLKVIEIDVYSDDRGFFCERFNKKKFLDNGLPADFVQDNHSRSKPSVVRGLHYQKKPDQAKLVSCVAGEILDVVVDIRENSPSFGKHFSIELTEENGKMLYVPAGFAHGFSVLGNENAHVIYKVDGLYNPSGEGGIKFDDENLNIDWRIKNPQVSDRDKGMQSFSDYIKNPVF